MKEIFDWLREKLINERDSLPTIFEADECFNNGINCAINFINEAEAKWKEKEAELRANVIDEFYDTVLNFEDYIEPIEERNGVLLYSGRDITNMIADIKRKLKGEKE